ncbi:MAG: hypothetical protein JJE09_11450 [Bacteroidia bacterium]|nr:hypothetical protein [Bacteroidia bacterium]
MEFVKTSTDIFGIEIMEPMTVATDLLVSAVCLYAFTKIKIVANTLPSIRLLKYYFLTLAVSTAYGGIIGHALQNVLSFGWKVPGWLLSMMAIAMIERAAILHAQPILRSGIGKFFAILNIIELIGLISVVLLTLNFFFVEAHAAYGLLAIVSSFELFIYIKTKNEGSRLLLIAVIISAIAATVHLMELSIHAWFNHLDLSHILMAMAAYVFYLGTIKIKGTY